ncbi:winged helix-turn-helix domain-containing protein [Methanomassiliicoccus luminyensis]|jgi:hypothetical protein|uniref:winged helix-turn-helix domain-containing protein n=1 Tax=Methanomassiliicoccus luminyensis TaxID=1080712 RepID=UPI00035F1079|nr:helix-turn-helix domain-containing protein [Methanomassiliicoccus luminyensis]
MKKPEVHKAFVDDVAARILIAALGRPLTALDVRDATGIPVAKVFYRIKLLEKHGLLSESGKVVDRKGREVPLYRSNLYNTYFFIDHSGKLRVRFQLVAENESQEDFTVDGSALV